MTPLALLVGATTGALVPDVLRWSGRIRGLDASARTHDRLRLAALGLALALVLPVGEPWLLVLSAALLATAEADRRWGIIPTELALAVALGGLLADRRPPTLLLSAAAAASVYALLALLSRVTHEGIGMGDVRLVAASFFAFGPLTGAASFATANLLALLALAGRRLLGAPPPRHVRMGPWLLLATAIVCSAQHPHAPNLF